MKLATIIATCLMGACSLGLGAEAEIARAPQSAPEAGLEELSKFITLRGEGAHFENVCRSLFERTRDYRRNGTTHALNEAKLYADEALVLMSLLQDLTEGEEVKMRTAALSLLAEGLLELSTYVEPSCRDRYFNDAVKIAAENASCAAQVQEHIERLQKRTSQLAQLKAKLPKGAWLPPNELALRTDPLTNLIAVAEKMLSEPLPQPSDTDYFLLWTTGNRTDYEKTSLICDGNFMF